MAQEILDIRLEDYEIRLARICLNLEKILSLAFNGFVKHRSKSLNEASRELDGLKSDIKDVSDSLEQSYFTDDKRKASVIVAVPAHLERILSNTYIMIEATRKKIDESVLFSEKAVKGLDYLYKCSGELLRDISDAIRTKNQTLLRHIIKQSAVLTRKADEFATEHEERLIKGLCSMKSSPIFLDILDSFKGIVWHTSQIAQRV